MKNVLLIGGSGFVGSAILKELLDRGYKVTTLVRNPDKITIKSSDLTIVKGDVSDFDEIKKLATGKDAVISAYNPGWNNPNIYEETLKNYPRILDAVKAAGVKRFLIVGGAGTLFVAPGVRVMDTGVIPEEIMGGVKSLGEFYLNTLMPENEIDWVFFSPAGEIAPGEKTGKYRLGKDDLIVDENGKSRISTGDYAAAMVDELEKPTRHKERFTIGY
ncbi:MAG: NAD(P)-dependent oxidoreductase [Bacteroidales bacterium]